jgi:hypothetical protein
MARIGGKPPMQPSGNTPGLISGSLSALRDENFMLTLPFSAALY